MKRAISAILTAALVLQSSTLLPLQSRAADMTYEFENGTIHDTGDNVTEVVTLTGASGGTRCADVYEISLEAGANICQWEYWGGGGQKFILEPVAAQPEQILGDVNADGKCIVLDVVMMQKFFLNIGDLTDASAGDLCEDGRINVFDLAIMKRMLLA